MYRVQSLGFRIGPIEDHRRTPRGSDLVYEPVRLQSCVEPPVVAGKPDRKPMGWFDDNFDNFLGYGIGMLDDCDMDEGECVNCGRKGMKFESAMDKGIDWGMYTGHPDAIRTCNKCKKDHKSCMTEIMAVKKYKVLSQGDVFGKLRREGRHFTQKPETMGMQCRTSTYFWVVDLEEAAAKLGWQPKENSKAIPKESSQATKRTASVAGMLGLPSAKASAAVNADGKPVRRCGICRQPGHNRALTEIARFYSYTLLRSQKFEILSDTSTSTTSVLVAVS